MFCSGTRVTFSAILSLVHTLRPWLLLQYLCRKDEENNCSTDSDHKSLLIQYTNAPAKKMPDKSNSRFTSYRKNSNNWTVCYVVGLSSLSQVKDFLFFYSVSGERGCVFAVFPPREGNF
ncbi:hypothetical protein L873DRAFT_476624 [Choiromyces venosus 120613-1]|uniref:Secreted protein n=1 Tax=Choiromyces venosus 120613-1 TaxID=1336337 RepID=A0A3N4IVY5_9PEZI|nr:hypothetical protein L873DRAFT_476624 [Choiromyces venosus 120613-1]